ncbi:MAG: radical SAM family heme chaperone HemW [Pseudomonadota bacterium]|nr:radical SAM family heme chaperone HemW [Pseudomonadota bacterium]
MDRAAATPATPDPTGRNATESPGFTHRPPMGLYVHLPWCVRKCPYCDFNSFAAGEGPIPERAYLDALLLELEGYVRMEDWPAVESVFIGGGTPSLFSAEGIERLLTGTRRRIALSPAAEVTLEANPGTVEQGRFGEFRQAGINRLSIGIQTFDDDALLRIGRIHTAAEAIRAAEGARAAGFNNINLDIMFGLPGQDRKSALADVATAISLAPDHISRYQLTIEPDTAFHVRPPRLPADDSIWNMQVSGQRMLMHRGYTHYEVSAFAVPGRQCRHNRNYWEFGDYIGIGAGAHGKLTRPDQLSITRTGNTRRPRAWMEQVSNRRQAGTTSRVVCEDLPFEFMLNALRLEEGFEYELFEERTGLPRDAISPRVRTAENDGLLRIEGGRIVPTELGGRFLNDLMARFLP